MMNLARCLILVIAFGQLAFCAERVSIKKPVGSLFVLTSKTPVGWDVQADVDSWQSEDAATCIVATGQTPRVIVVKTWSVKQVGEHYVPMMSGSYRLEVTGDGPTPNPDPPVPPGPIVVPNKWGLGKPAYEIAVKLKDPATAKKLAELYDKASQSMSQATTEDQMDAVYSALTVSIDAVANANWATFRKTLRDAVQALENSGKLGSGPSVPHITAHAECLKEIASALSVVK